MNKDFFERMQDNLEIRFQESVESHWNISDPDYQDTSLPEWTGVTENMIAIYDCKCGGYFYSNSATKLSGPCSDHFGSGTFSCTKK